MEQAYELLSIGVPSRDIRSLVAIAVKAGMRQIVGRRLSAVLASANVIDLKRKSVLRMRNTAIFASSPGSFPNKVNKRWIHEPGVIAGSRFKKRRARDCRMESKLPTCR